MVASFFSCGEPGDSGLLPRLAPRPTSLVRLARRELKNGDPDLDPRCPVLAEIVEVVSSSSPSLSKLLMGLGLLKSAERMEAATAASAGEFVPPDPFLECFPPLNVTSSINTGQTCGKDGQTATGSSRFHRWFLACRERSSNPAMVSTSSVVICGLRSRTRDMDLLEFRR